ncbi:MAG: helical backbone metal receptor [Acidobacteria bacterium]|nr:helical backbone metal receptor [Acidobacteriota bacterium]
MKPPTRRQLIASAVALVLPLGCGGAGPGEQRAADTPQRIIALAPSVAEILHVLGLDNRVVGVGDYVTWPPELAAKPRLGGLFNPDFEGIITLEPDLAVLLRSEESLRGRLEAIGVEVLSVPSETLGDVELAIQRIAARCGVKDRADTVLRQWRLDLVPAPVDDLLRVVLVVGREPRRLGDMVVAGPGTFFDQLLSRLGAINAFYDVDTRYPQVGIEEILRRRPEVVLEVQPLVVPESRELALLADWRELAERAGGEGPCVQLVQGAHMLVPGPRLPRVYAQLRRALEACIPVEEDAGV